MIDFKDGDNFEELIKQNRVVIIQYGSHSCSPCHALRQNVESWEQDHPDVLTVHICIDDHIQLAIQQGVLSVPTIAVYIEGREVIKETGTVNLDKVLAKAEG